jgi:hypothetical protein
MRISTLATTALAGCLLALPPSAVSAQVLEAAASGPPITRIVNRDLQVLQEDSRSLIRLDAREGDGIAILDGAAFSEGVIELDVRGEDAQGRSFVGVAFHVQNDSTFEAVYLRPFNFRASDPVRQRRALQYISQPAYTWYRLREESPGAYESAVQPALDPDGWVRLRIVVSEPELQVYAGGGAEPDLVVQRLGGLKSGQIGLWVGNGSAGDFANVRITPASNPHR